MAFDPDAFLQQFGGPAPAAPPPAAAPGPSTGGFNPDVFLSKFGAPPAPAPAQAAPTTDMLTSAARGFKQGLSGNWGDEIWGGLAAGFTDKTYEQARDESRAADKAAQESHPFAFGAGEVAGGVAGAAVTPELGLLKGGGFAVNAARGAAQGIVSGAGASDGHDAKEVIQDAAKGGLIGAATGGVLGTVAEKVVRGAPERVDERLVQAITGGRATTAGKKIYQNEDLVLNAARKFGLDDVLKKGGAEAFDTAAEAARKDVGQQIGQAFEAADQSFLGVKTKEVASAVRATAGKYRSPVEAPIRKQIEALAKQVETDWGGKATASGPSQSWTEFLKGRMGPAMEEHGSHGAALKALSAEYRQAGGQASEIAGGSARVPLAEVNNLVGKLEAIGFAGADVTPGAAKQLQRDLGKNVEGVLQRRMKEIQEFAGNVKATPTAGNSPPLAQSMTAADQLAKLTELNKDYRGLKLITKMRTELAAVPPSNRAAGGLRDIAGKAVDAGLLFSHPAAFVAKKGLDVAKNVAAPAADEILSKITLAAQGGAPTAALIQRAIEAGIPRATIAGALDLKGHLK